jgi:hypothetical protein
MAGRCGGLTIFPEIANLPNTAAATLLQCAPPERDHQSRYRFSTWLGDPGTSQSTVFLMTSDGSNQKKRGNQRLL